MRRIVLYILLFIVFIGKAQRADSLLFKRFHEDVRIASKNLEADSISIFNTIKAYKNHENLPFQTYNSVVARKNGKIYIKGIENGFFYDGKELIQIIDANKRINRLPLSQIKQLTKQQVVSDFTFDDVKNDSIAVSSIGSVKTYHWFTQLNEITSVHISIDTKKMLFIKIEYGYAEIDGEHMTKSVIDYRIEKTKDNTISVSLNDFIEKSSDGHWITKGKFSNYSFFDARASSEKLNN